MHYTFKKNKKVFVIMKSGEAFVDRWLKWERKSFFFKVRGEVRIGKIRTVTIYRPQISVVEI